VKTKLERLEESTELRGFLNRLLERDAEQLAHGIEETGLLTNVKATVKAVPRDEEAPEIEFKVDGLSDKPPKEMKK